MRLLFWLLWPVSVFVRLLRYPFLRRAAGRALRKHGWVELSLDGEILEVRPTESFSQHVARRLLRREEAPRIVLGRLRRFVAELAKDRHAKGILVRVGNLGGGWAAADELRLLLQRLRDAEKTVAVQLVGHCGNRELLVASAAEHLSMPPVAALAAVGASAKGLFLADTLEKLGVKVEVASAGLYKSAPDQVTRTERSSYDREQSQALVDALDAALIAGLRQGRGLTEARAVQLLDESPMVGKGALEAGFIDSLARDEDLPELVQKLANRTEPPELMGAGDYLDLKEVPPPWVRKKKSVGIVEVTGAIVDEAPNYPFVTERMAVEKVVVNDLRAALEDDDIGAVVLYVNSRGGSVSASDTIYSAVKRLDREKPVIACFADVAASGGYYVACGARAIVASPLTITGSIGVFAMMPTWRRLAEMLAVHHDTLRNRKHATLYDPWSDFTDEERAHAQKEVGAMYRTFVGLVAEARQRPYEEMAQVAEGRVWTGRDAHERHLLDGLGGMEEALHRAQTAAGGRFHPDPELISARHPMPRPAPPSTPDALLQLIFGHADAQIAREILTLALRPGIYAYSPLNLSE